MDPDRLAYHRQKTKESRERKKLFESLSPDSQAKWIAEKKAASKEKRSARQKRYIKKKNLAKMEKLSSSSASPTPRRFVIDKEAAAIMGLTPE